jgi:3-deoxy-D-manno-octulosonate 8-phosphate phosphatase (KDO 8-P phosphatase)
LILDKFAQIDTFLLDVDGVLTNGSVIATDGGEMRRSFNIKDGFALQFAVKQGYNVIIISGGNAEGVRSRLKNLGIKHVFTGVANKRDFLLKLSEDMSLDLDNCLYMGDDYPDISVMNLCGLKVCPNDAVWEIKENSDWITQSNGGEGAVREIIERTLLMQDKWESSDHSVW